MMNSSDKNPAEIPSHLQRWPGLYVRMGDKIVDASAEDIETAKSYPEFIHKGPLQAGKRITIMTRKTVYSVNEEVRVIHIAEVAVPGHQVYVMGPKAVYGEYIEQELVTDPVPERVDPLIPRTYNGAVLASPAVDYNYEITSYTFAEPKTYEIFWQLDYLKSNVLKLEVIDA